MTIASVRIYYWPKDKEFERYLNRSFWGFAEWFECRLKPIREQLRGPEAKGVNIVNFMLYDDPGRAWRLDQWGQRMNSFEYSCVYDLESLRLKSSLGNIEHLMQMTAEIAGRAPWPQVLAVGRALAVPLTDEERTSLGLFFNGREQSESWRSNSKIGRKKAVRMKRSKSTTARVCCQSMRAQLEAVCATHSSAADCPDKLVGRFGVPGTYGLYVHDGGSSYVGINYCPWCGERLSGRATKDRKEPLQ